jgi:hypothetical protein
VTVQEAEVERRRAASAPAAIRNVGHTANEEMRMDARQLIETYHNAWTTGDFVTARRCLADNLDFRGSIDTFQKADDFLNELKGFKGMLRDTRLLKSYFDLSGGALLYDCETATPAGVVRTSEFFSVDKGKITEIRLVFDATELRKLMGSR